MCDDLEGRTLPATPSPLPPPLPPPSQTGNNNLHYDAAPTICNILCLFVFLSVSHSAENGD